MLLKELLTRSTYELKRLRIVQKPEDPSRRRLGLRKLSTNLQYIPKIRNSPARHPEPEPSEGEGPPKLGTVPLSGDPSSQAPRDDVLGSYQNP